MSKFPMDLSKFKKVKSDGKTSTFQHYAGHSITVAHGKLSSKMREQLESLPMTKSKKMAEGGEVDSIDSEEPMPNPQPTSETPSPGASGSWDSAQADQQQGQGLQLQAPPAAAAPPTDNMLQGPAQAPAPADPFGKVSGINQQIKGVEDVAAGQAAEQKALSRQGAHNVVHEMEYQTQQEEALNKFNETNAFILKERQALQSDIAHGHINPSRYVENMSTAGKISSIIGLIVGGAGAGLTHGPNLASEYLDNQIARDIDSQKADLGKKENLLSHNLRETGDLRDAYNLTKIQQNDILNSRLREEAARTTDPLAQARIMQIVGKREQDTAQLTQQLAMHKMVMGGSSQSGPDPAKMVPLLVPKEHQAQAFKEIQAAEDTKKMSSSILASFEQAVKENTVMRTGAGLLRTPGSVYALHQSMQPTFKDLEGTVRQAAMDNTFKNITPSPGDMEDTIRTKRQALQDYLQSKLSAPTARAYGIDLNKLGRTAPNTPINGSTQAKINFQPMKTK